jgi:molybdopterin/thiamine biosynthesis adenylyltransferase
MSPKNQKKGPKLTKTEKERYSRQMIIPNWGEETQKRIKSSKVFIAGTGGLASPVSINLALAGVGTLRICDHDSLELSNLNRQFLHDDSRIGINKARSAKMTLNALNPDIFVEAIAEKITEENIENLVGDSELIIDCLDNYPTRYHINAAAVKKRIPMIHGSVWGLEGMISFFHHPETPCLACIFPDAPPQEVFPVLGATPSITGSIQAMEALKYLANLGTTLKGRILWGDYSEMSFKEFKIKKNPDCPVCSV